jgi:ribonuclease E
MAIDVVRLLILAAQRPDIAEIAVSVHQDVAAYLNNRKRRELTRMEEESQKTLQVIGLHDVSPEYLIFACRDAEGRDVRFSDGHP